MRLAPLLALLLAGCATAPGIERESDYQRLARECRARGGILVPFGRPLTGRVETDFACEFRGGSPRTR